MQSPKVEEELRNVRAELSSHQREFKEKLGRQKSVHKETKTSLTRSEKRCVEYFVAIRLSVSQTDGFRIEQTNFERRIHDLQYRLDGGLIK